MRGLRGSATALWELNPANQERVLSRVDLEGGLVGDDDVSGSWTRQQLL